VGGSAVVPDPHTQTQNSMYTDGVRGAVATHTHTHTYSQKTERGLVGCCGTPGHSPHRTAQVKGGSSDDTQT